MAELVRYPTDILEAVYDTHRYTALDKLLNRLEDDYRQFYGKNVVLSVNGNADRLGGRPIVRQRFRPARIDRVARCHHGAGRLRLGALLEHALRDAEHRHYRNETASHQQIAFRLHIISPNKALRRP